MSYKATNWAYDLPLKGSAKPVLVVLADMADESNSCFPSQERIASMTGLGSRTVRRAILRLEAAGMITRTARYDKNGHRSSDRYVLAVGESLPANLTTGHSDHRSESPSLPANLTAPTGHSGQVTINEPSVEPSVSSSEAVAVRPDVVYLLDLLDSEIERNGSKRPTRSKKNTDAMRLLLDRDGKTVQQVEAAIRWCQSDNFWRSNILSAHKLREKYDQLRLAASRKRTTFAQQSQDNALALVERYRQEEAREEVADSHGPHLHALHAGR